MGRKRKKAELKPFCFFCDRQFADEGTLIAHQKTVHFKCVECKKRLTGLQALMQHSLGVHKVETRSVPGARPDRDTVQYNILGMAGVPQDIIDARAQAEKAEKRAKAAASGAAVEEEEEEEEAPAATPQQQPAQQQHQQASVPPPPPSPGAPHPPHAQAAYGYPGHGPAYGGYPQSGPYGAHPGGYGAPSPYAPRPPQPVSFQFFQSGPRPPFAPQQPFGYPAPVHGPPPHAQTQGPPQGQPAAGPYAMPPPPTGSLPPPPPPPAHLSMPLPPPPPPRAGAGTPPAAAAAGAAAAATPAPGASAAAGINLTQEGSDEVQFIFEEGADGLSMEEKRAALSKYKVASSST